MFFCVFFECFYLFLFIRCFVYYLCVFIFFFFCCVFFIVFFCLFILKFWSFLFCIFFFWWLFYFLFAKYKIEWCFLQLIPAPGFTQHLWCDVCFLLLEKVREGDLLEGLVAKMRAFVKILFIFVMEGGVKTQTTSIQLKVLEITSKSSMIGSWQWGKHLFYLCIFPSILSILCFFWILFCFLFVIFIFCVFVFIFLCLFSFWFSFYLVFSYLILMWF